MISQLLLLFVIGFIASFIGSLLSGITSVLSLGMMMLTGLPPQVAVATYKFGILGSRIGGLPTYWKAKKIHWGIIIPLCFCAFFGSAIGANILVRTDEALLAKISGVILAIFLFFAVIDRSSGIQRQHVSPTKQFFGYVMYFLMSIWCGFFPAGTGLIFLHIYLLLFGLTILEIKGTDRIPAMFIDIGAILVFLPHGIVNFAYVAAFLPGMFLGGHFGAKTTLRVGDKNLKKIVIVSAFIMVLLLFFRR